MKNCYCLLVFLFLSSVASFGQNVNVYQHFSELKGMEDYNGNTNLLYRIYSFTGNGNNYSSENNIYLLNVSTRYDSIFQYAGGYYYEHIGGGGRSVLDYKFWDKDPSKYIVCGSQWGDDPNGYIERFDGYRYSHSFSDYTFLGISQQNDSLVYSTVNGDLLKSTTGGKEWDTAGKFNAISMSPYNDKVLFAVESGKLFKTKDGGITKYPVDTIHSIQSLIYDKDTNYIYGIAYSNFDYTLLISNNAGEINSWQVVNTFPLYLAPDYSTAGTFYLSNMNLINLTRDFGNSFSLIKTFEKNLVGIYKKPGTSKLYAATYDIIYEIDGEKVNIIKQLPIDKEIFKFDPLDVGNKWVYNMNLYNIWRDGVDTNIISVNEIIKDTILADNHEYKQIKSTSMYHLLSYERIDSVTGIVYFWDNDLKTSRIGDDLNVKKGDLIYGNRFSYSSSPLVFDSITTKNIFGMQKEVHSLHSYQSDSQIINYSLTKDLGLTHQFNSWMGENTITYDLKGAIIKGVVYGDTSLIVGINDNVPVQSKEFALSQNYPNPFNPSTTIKYSLPVAGNVKLTVYNAIGSKVATVVNEYKSAGNYSVQFNGSNLASGIYLYRLEAGDFSAVKKFILLK
jgi:hypothetical protein